jgi:hypothetical protein
MFSDSRTASIRLEAPLHMVFMPAGGDIVVGVVYVKELLKVQVFIKKT